MEKLYYPCSENKGADQLRSYCEADLRLWFRMCKYYTKYKSNTNCIWQRITKTCPCNIQRFFSAVISENYIHWKMFEVFIFLLKTYIVGTRYNSLGEAVLTSTHNVCFESKIRKKYRYNPAYPSFAI